MSRQRDAILEAIDDDEPVIFFEPEGMDIAILGLSEHQPGRESCVVYDYAMLLWYFTAQGMDREDAEEWMAFNTLGAWFGDRTPIVIRRQE